jgi:hypothetical protein
MNRLIRSAALGALLAVPAATALAATHVTATLGPISVTLYSLDGSTPWIQFDGQAQTYGQLSAQNSLTGENSFDQFFGTAMEPFAMAVAATDAGATLGLSGPGAVEGSTLTASGFAAGVPAGTNDLPEPVYAVSQFSAFVAAPSSAAFTLSPMTLAVFGAVSTLEMAVTAAWDPGLSYGQEAGSAQIQLQANGVGPSGVGTQSSSSDHTRTIASLYVNDDSCVFQYCYLPASLAETLALTATFANLSGEGLGGWVLALATINGYSYANPVPEPGPLALMLAGLGVVGLVVSRRRGRGAQV